ncbi:hypothetical protein [Allonocardiopsis opalescens]|nr:hypothetical protein [Allonocardiopsis opalescens]
MLIDIPPEVRGLRREYPSWLIGTIDTNTGGRMWIAVWQGALLTARDHGRGLMEVVDADSMEQLAERLWTQEYVRRRLAAEDAAAADPG